MNVSIYDLRGLDAALAGTIYAGKLHFSHVTESTNTDALAAARAGAPHGSVYFTDEQLAGRGRGDHAWHSAAGQGIYVSIVLRLNIPTARLPLLPLAAGLAAAEAIRAATGVVVDIRWPNDLLIDSDHAEPRKVGGILVEAKIESSELAFAVAGIGINVHQREFPSNVSTPATSLDLESAKPVARQAILIELLKCVEREANGMLDFTTADKIRERVQHTSSWMRGRRVEVHGPQACIGMTEGLDENGFLLVRTVDGVRTVQTGGLRAAQNDSLHLS